MKRVVYVIQVTLEERHEAEEAYDKIERTLAKWFADKNATLSLHSEEIENLH